METEAAAMRELGYSGDRILEQSKDNATGAFLATLAYLKERHQSPPDWIAYVGRRYATTGWQSVRKDGVKAVARMAALNWVSLGATLTALSGDDTQAEFSVSWPTQEWRDALGVDPADSDIIFGVFGPIAESIGLHYEWHREGAVVRSRFYI